MANRHIDTRDDSRKQESSTNSKLREVNLSLTILEFDLLTEILNGHIETCTSFSCDDEAKDTLYLLAVIQSQSKESSNDS